MTCSPAPACKAALAEANQRWPVRSRASDGICASPRHTRQNPTSDHEPDRDGLAHAVDVTHDPARGVDCDYLAAEIVRRRDPRVKYLIRNRTIWRSYDKPGLPAWTPQRYTGPNPHTTHMHISILKAAENDIASWFATVPKPAAKEQTLGVYKDDNDERAAFVELCYHAILGRQVESVEARNLWVMHLFEKGGIKTVRAIAATPEAKARRKAVG